MGDDQQQPRRRNSWPWKKLKLGRSSCTSDSSKNGHGDRALHLSPSQLSSPASSFKAEESTRFASPSWKQEALSSKGTDDGRIGEAIALREKAEESLVALKQELSTLMNDLNAKEALVKQHQKVADEAVSGWEKAEKDSLSLKQELEAAFQSKRTFEDRVLQLDGALKECMRQVRHVREEQEAKLQEAIACKNTELSEMRADMEARQAGMQMKLMESEAQCNVMTKSLQERARKILEINEAKSKADAELNVMQVKLASAEKEISSLQYELNLLSKELEIRNEEVAYCKRSADMSHKQHLDDVQKMTRLEADCLRLRILLKKKLPGPAAISHMRKEVESLQINGSSAVHANIQEFKRRPSRSYADTTISFTNSHQRGIANGINRNLEMLQDRLVAVEEENRLLKESLSKRGNDLQASWLLCAKTANKLSIAEDHLESLQQTPRGHPKIDYTFDLPSATIGAAGIAAGSDVETEFAGHDDVEETSCAESWASALIGELAHFKKEKIIFKEAIKQVTESNLLKEPPSKLDKDVHEDKCPVVDDVLPEIKEAVSSEMWDIQEHHEEGNAMNLLCEGLDRKLGKIREVLQAGDVNKILRLLDAAQKTFSQLEKTICGRQLVPMKLVVPEDVIGNGTLTVSIPTLDESESNEGTRVLELDNVKATVTSHEGPGSQSSTPIKQSIDQVKCEDPKPLMQACPSSDTPVKQFDANYEEEKNKVGSCSELDNVLSKVINLLEIMPLGVRDTSGWDEEKQGLGACKERFLQGDASMSELLERFGLVLSRACNAKLPDLKHTLVSVTNNDESDQEVSAPAAVFNASPAPSRQPGEGMAIEQDVVGKLDADELITSKNKCHEANVVCELDADKAMTANNADDLNGVAREQAEDDVAMCNKLEAAPEKPHKSVADMAAGAAKVACVDAGHLAFDMESERGRLCKEVAIRKVNLLETQAQLSHYKMLHSQLQTRNEKLERLDADGECNAVPKSLLGGGLKGIKESKTTRPELVEAKAKLAECERTMLALGKHLQALSSSASPPPRQPTSPQSDDPPTDPGRRGLPTRFLVVSGPQDRRRSGQRLLDNDDDSSPLSARSSSAAPSPGRFNRQIAGMASTLRCVSLTQSLDAAATHLSSSANYSKGSPRQPRTPTAGSSFGRLFSRSRTLPG